MSARQLPAWLWAAVWLRWRLAVAKARGLVGERPAPAGVGAGYRLSGDDVPVEGIDYDPNELPPQLLSRLQDTRAELLRHARGTTGQLAPRHRARRRRMVSLVTAAIVTLTLLGAGATALMTGSTGVPEVDRLLGIHEAKLTKPPEPDRFGPGADDFRPRSTGETSSVVVKLGNGFRRLVSASYVNRTGDICSVVTDAGQSRDKGDIRCVTPPFLRTRLQQTDGIVVGVLTDEDALVVVGFVAAAAKGASVRGPRGVLETEVGRAWTPHLADVGSLRPFVALGKATSATGPPHDYVVESDAIAAPHR